MFLGDNQDGGDPDPFTAKVAYKTDGIMCPAFSHKKEGADECDYDLCPEGKFINVMYSGMNSKGEMTNEGLDADENPLSGSTNTPSMKGGVDNCVNK